MFLRAEVERVHKILDEGPSASSSVKECLNCVKMQESQKKLEKLIDSQKVCKGKAGIGYCPSTEEAKGKAIVKELNVTEKKKNAPQRFNGYYLKCNTYSHKASNYRVIKKSERIPTSNRFAVLEIQCYRCGMVGHMARQCMKDVSIKYFKYRKLGHYAWNCMQHSLVQCYRCHIFGHIARNCMTILSS